MIVLEMEKKSFRKKDGSKVFANLFSLYLLFPFLLPYRAVDLPKG